jgi:hypothetical protein
MKIGVGPVAKLNSCGTFQTSLLAKVRVRSVLSSQYDEDTYFLVLNLDHDGFFHYPGGL